jgi:hypothetical protein
MGKAMSLQPASFAFFGHFNRMEESSRIVPLPATVGVNFPASGLETA